MDTVPSEIFSFDSHYLFFTFLIITALNYSAFIISYLLQVDFLTDFVGSLGFIVAVIIPFAKHPQPFEHSHRVFIFFAVLISRVQLGGFLFFRVINRGRDRRFDTIRNSFSKFFAFWTFQIIWAYCVSFNSVFTIADIYNPETSLFTICGSVLFCLSFIYQLIADIQKYRFRSDSKNDNYPFTTGLWKYSRHPNYFGEIFVWYSLFIITIPTLINSKQKWGWVSILSPMISELILLFLSGIPTSEGKNLFKYYQNPNTRKIITNYQKQTSPILPFPPSWYSSLPAWIKIVFFAEFPMYQCKGFNEN